MTFTNKDLVTRIVGIVQIFTAIVITGVGIGISVKFHKIHHENGTPYEAALNYINNPWTTVYAAGVWMGLIIGIAAIFGMFIDLKPHKNKYKYYTIGCNIIVLVVEIIVIIFSIHSYTWYSSKCKYIYIKSNGTRAERDCSADDKSTGKTMYLVQIIFLVINAVVTVAVLIMTLLNDIEVFENCCDRIVYRVKRKDKMTHQFSGEANPYNPSSNPTSAEPYHQQDSNSFNTGVNTYV